jgi:hypothetical protein
LELCLHEDENESSATMAIDEDENESSAAMAIDEVSFVCL